MKWSLTRVKGEIIPRVWTRVRVRVEDRVRLRVGFRVGFRVRNSNANSMVRDSPLIKGRSRLREVPNTLILLGNFSYFAKEVTHEK